MHPRQHSGQSGDFSYARCIRRNDLPKFIQLCRETPCPSENPSRAVVCILIDPSLNYVVECSHVSKSGRKCSFNHIFGEWIENFVL